VMCNVGKLKLFLTCTHDVSWTKQSGGEPKSVDLAKRELLFTLSFLKLI